MARRVSTSQLRSKLRQIQQKQRQAINNYNQAVNKYNREVRSYNARVCANRQRLQSELNRLNRQRTTTRYVIHTTYTTSVQTLHQTYSRMEREAEIQQWDPMYYRVLDLSEREAANSLEVTNRLLGTDPYSEEYDEDLQDAALTNQLREISEDLDSRWKGAVFALNPRNPDAARHFCTSAREIFTQILEIKAPDSEVINLLPKCDLTPQGNPTRRSKIKYLLHRRGMTEDSLEDFVEQDMDNIVKLFGVFNDGTHGSAGTYDLHQLNAIKKRVENGIVFLAEIVGDV